MTTKKKKTYTTRLCKPYPKPCGTRGGHSVDWYFFKTEAEAEACSAVALYNREVMREEGYSWYYHVPGEVQYQDTGDHAGLWRVTIP